MVFYSAQVHPHGKKEEPVRLEPRIPGLRVKRFTTEPLGTPNLYAVELDYFARRWFVAF